MTSPMPPADALDAPRPRLRVVVGLTGAAAVTTEPQLPAASRARVVAPAG